MRYSVLVLILLAAPFARAEDCDARRFVNDLNTLSNWRKIHSAFKQYSKCDDGLIAEGFDDVIVKALALKWETLSEAHKIISKDPSFYKFFLNHIGPTADTEELKRVIKNSNEQCPKKFGEFCAAIRSRALEAVRIQEGMR